MNPATSLQERTAEASLAFRAAVQALGPGVSDTPPVQRQAAAARAEA